VHITFAVFADAANLSQEGKLNVLGIFDALQVANFPTVHPRAYFVVRLKGSRADVGQHTMSFRWINPRGAELWSSTGELHLEAASGAAGEVDLPVIAVLDLPLDGTGQYTMLVELGNAQTVPVPVTVTTAVVPPIPTSGLVS